MNTVDDPNIAEQVRPVLRLGLRIASGLLVIGVGLSLAGWALATTFIFAGLAVLVVMPVINVIVGLIDEARLRQWWFVAAAVLVLVILAANALHKW